MDLCESGIKPILTYHLINFKKEKEKNVLITKLIS